jgi:hypothetical protein
MTTYCIYNNRSEFIALYTDRSVGEGAVPVGGYLMVKDIVDHDALEKVMDDAPRQKELGVLQRLAVTHAYELALAGFNACEEDSINTEEWRDSFLDIVWELIANFEHLPRPNLGDEE